MKLRAILYGMTIVTLLVGGVYSAKAAEWWQTSGKVNPNGTKVELSGENTTEIKGWMTLGEVISAYQLSEADVALYFQLSDELPLDTPLKDLAALTEERLTPSTIRAYIEENQ